MAYETIRALIWGKTYPELSYKYVETVCTGAVREDGLPVRLFPVPLRYLHGPRQYRLYDWIEVPVEKSTRDPRPESYKVDRDAIQIVGHIDSSDGWRQRRDAVFRNPGWQFGSVEALQAARKASRCSMGIVTPGSIERVTVEHRRPSDQAQWAAKWAEIQAQGDMFHPQYKELQYLPYRIRLAWRCADACRGCRRAAHEMGVLDWGLLELARKTSDPEMAANRLRAITDAASHDFKIFMGTFRLRMYQFGIIGLWYPKLGEQLELL